MYGPVRTVVWQGSAGDRGPYADQMEMDSTVGVLLHEIPAAVGDQAAATLLAEPADFWTDRAAQQIWLTDYRLDYRGSYYQLLRICGRSEELGSACHAPCLTPSTKRFHRRRC